MRLCTGPGQGGVRGRGLEAWPRQTHGEGGRVDTQCADNGHNTSYANNITKLYVSRSPEKSLSCSLSMSDSVEVPQHAADHVQEVKAAHAPSLPPLSSLSWEDRYN